MIPPHITDLLFEEELKLKKCFVLDELEEEIDEEEVAVEHHYSYYEC